VVVPQLTASARKLTADRLHNAKVGYFGALLSTYEEIQ
jgi:hypothetical protein